MPLPLLAAAAPYIAATAPSVIGGALSYFSGKDSAKAQRDAAQAAENRYREAIATQKEYGQKGVDVLKPYEETGRQGLLDYSQGLKEQVQPGFKYSLGEFNFDKYTDPSTQYMMDQARRAREASAFAKGSLGGGTLRALNTESQNLANTGYKNAYDRYFDMEKFKNLLGTESYARDYTYDTDRLKNQFQLGQLGMTAGTNQASIYSNVGKDTAATLQGIGGIQAGGITGSQQAQTEGMNAFIQNLLQGAGKAYDVYKGAK